MSQYDKYVDVAGPSSPPNKPVPPDRPAAPRKGRTEPKFVITSHDQIGFPMSRRGMIPDAEHLSAQEKLLLFAIGTDAWKHGGRCKLTNAELANAMGLQGPKASGIRIIKYLLYGRKIRGTMRPGLLARGFVVIRPDDDRKNPSGRTLERTAKWLVSRKNHPEIKVWVGEGPAEVPELTASAAPTHPTVAAAPTLAPEFRSGDPGSDPAEAPAPPAAMSRDNQAARLVEGLRRRGILFTLRPDGSVQYGLRASDVEPVSEAELADLRSLKSEIVALLRREHAPAQPRPEAAEAEGEKPAPTVAQAAQAEVRRLIGRLRADPDEALPAALADRLVALFRDKERERSRATYFGLAHDVQSGALPESILHEAFEVACKSNKRNRGAAFIAEVKRLKAEKYGRRSGC